MAALFRGSARHPEFGPQAALRHRRHVTESQVDGLSGPTTVVSNSRERRSSVRPSGYLRCIIRTSRRAVLCIRRASACCFPEEPSTNRPRIREFAQPAHTCPRPFGLRRAARPPRQETDAAPRTSGEGSPRLDGPRLPHPEGRSRGRGGLREPRGRKRSSPDFLPRACEEFATLDRRTERPSRNPPCAIDRCQQLAFAGKPHVVGTEGPVRRAQRLERKSFRLVVAPRCVIHGGEIRHRRGQVVVVPSESPALDGQRACIQFFGVRKVSEHERHAGGVIDCLGKFRVVGRRTPFPRQRPIVQKGVWRPCSSHYRGRRLPDRWRGLPPRRRRGQARSRRS